MSKEKLYAERDIMALDQHGLHYTRHVFAMTAEGLHSKSDIAAELAHRDHVIQRQKDLILAVDDALRDLSNEQEVSRLKGGAAGIRSAINKAHITVGGGKL